MKHQRTITIELDRIKITSSNISKRTVWCEFCRAETEFLDQNGAIEIARAMHTQGLNINKNTLHINQDDKSETLICLNSIVTGSSPVNS
jgi:hypothetical protein